MRIILLILILSMQCLACPQVVRTLFGRITHGTQGVSMMSLQLTGVTTRFRGRTTQLGYYRIEIVGCDGKFVFSGISKQHQFMTVVTFTQSEQELNILFPE